MHITYSSGSSAASLLFFALYILTMHLSLAAVALIMVSKWHIFKKLGLPGWKGIIPMYGDYTLFKTVWETKPFWALIIVSGVYSAVATVTIFLMTIQVAENMRYGGTGETAFVPVTCLIIFGVASLACIVFGYIITLKLCLRLARVFGKGTGFALGMTFIQIVFYPVLAFGKARRVS